MHDRDRKCLADTFQEYELSDYHVRPQRKLYGLSIDYHATYGHSESFFFVFVFVFVCQAVEKRTSLAIFWLLYSWFTDWRRHTLAVQ